MAGLAILKQLVHSSITRGARLALAAGFFGTGCAVFPEVSLRQGQLQDGGGVATDAIASLTDAGAGTDGSQPPTDAGWIPPDGGLPPPDGSVYPPDGSVYYPDGSIACVQGTGTKSGAALSACAR
jgi:hypothetical protein